MRTLITALAVTVVLATSALAKTERTKTVRAHPGNSVVRTSAIPLNDSYCHFHNGQTDPDSRVRLQLVRDCRYYESESE